MAKITKVDMIRNSILPLIEEHKHSAEFTTHSLSSSYASDPFPVNDFEVMEFLQKLSQKTEIATLTVSNIYWEEYSNCAGDELYPCTMRAVLLPDERYFITIEGYDYPSRKNFIKEYILDL